MKIACEVIQDILPLYEDEVCSEQTKEMVEEHLRECASCRGVSEKDKQWTFSVPEQQVDTEREEQAVVKSFRKIRNRWRMSVLATVLALVVVFLGYMGVNQCRGEGICYTNLDEILVGWRYVHALSKGEYEKAASYIDFASDYDRITKLLQQSVEDFQPSVKEVQIGEEVWYELGHEVEERLGPPEEGDGLAFWGSAIFNDYIPVLIPEECWQEIQAMLPEELMETGHGSYLVNHQMLGELEYWQLETRWGVYMVEENLYDTLQRATEEDYIFILSLIPEAMYQDLKGELELQAQEDYDSLHAYYGEVASMSKEAYVEQAKERYIAGLEQEAEKGVTMEGRLFESAYVNGDGWTIGYGAKVKKPDDEVIMHIYTSVKNGKVRSVHTATPSDRKKWLNDYIEAVMH